MNSLNPISTPLLSVRLMTYNHEPFIAQAIEGCLMQKTNFPFEVVIGDDFSSDNTLKIVQEYEKKFPNIIKVLERPYKGDYWKKRQKRGRYYNFINILENCKGKYIALLDGDDYWTDENKLQEQVEFLEKQNEYSFCCHLFDVVDENSNIIEHRNENLLLTQENGIEINKGDIFKKWISKSLTIVFRVSDLNVSLHKLKMFTDFILVYNLLKYKNGYCLKINAGNYRLHSTNIYANTNELKKYKFAVQTMKEILRSNKNDLALKKALIYNLKTTISLQKEKNIPSIKYYYYLLKYSNKKRKSIRYILKTLIK